MTRLSEKTIKELQDIIRQEYGKEISPREAQLIASGIVGFFDQLAKMYHKIKIENPELPVKNG
jgi:hypothetical protein